MGAELFKNIPSKVDDLVRGVRIGRIGLPDLQRPFVWADNKVRDLFDSMMKGYPIGYVMIWESPSDYETKKNVIGKNEKIHDEPKELVIDGQQRLTALVAAMYGVVVKDKNFADKEIKISFNPLTREFAVWTPAYERDTEWISRISDVFLAKEQNTIITLRRKFIKDANEGRMKKNLPELSEEEEITVENNINALLNLSDFSLIASSNAVVFSYVLYLIAKYDYKLDAMSLKKCISKWFFMSTITYFYTGSTESEVENQFADLRDVHTADEFVAYIDKVIETHFTDDYFKLTLPSELNSAAAIPPAWNGYIAAQIVLNTPMLFSNTPVSKYFVIGSSGTKNAIDKHHIFPKHYLEQIGYTNDRDRNQLANFTYLDYA